MQTSGVSDPLSHCLLSNSAFPPRTGMSAPMQLCVYRSAEPGFRHSRGWASTPTDGASAARTVAVSTPTVWAVNSRLTTDHSARSAAASRHSHNLTRSCKRAAACATPRGASVNQRTRRVADSRVRCGLARVARSPAGQTHRNTSSSRRPHFRGELEPKRLRYSLSH